MLSLHSPIDPALHPRCHRWRPADAWHAGRPAVLCHAGNRDPVRASIRGDVHCVSRGHTQLVPLIPAEGHLPFSTSLEYIPVDAYQTAPHLAAATRDIVEITYVLSGSGHLREAETGLNWPLQPGTSLITWANSTYLEPSPQSQTSSGEPLAVLKFHFPISVLDPSSPSTTLSKQQREALAQAWGTTDFPSSQRGTTSAAQTSLPAVLSDAEAVRLLHAAGARTRTVMHSSHRAPMVLLSNLGSQSQVPSHPDAAHSSTHHHLTSRHTRFLSAAFSLLHRAGGAQHTQSPVSHIEQPSTVSLPAIVGLLTSAVAAAVSDMTGAFHRMTSGPTAQLPALPLLFSWAHNSSESTRHHIGRVLREPLSHLHNLAYTAAHTAAQHLPPHLQPMQPLAAFTSSRPSQVQLPAQLQVDALGQPPILPDGSVGRASSPRRRSMSPTPTLADVFRAQLPQSQCVLMARTMEHFKAFRFPKQTNQLAFVFDPLELGLSLSFGVEIFEPGHHTPLHVHRTGHELFFVLSGEGDAFCDGQHIPVRAGDCIVFPPGALHGLDNNTDRKLYALQMMCPDDEFVAYVQSGTSVGRLDDEDICNLTATRC